LRNGFLLICGLGLLSFSCTFLSLLGTFVGLEQQINLVSLLKFNLICFLFESCNKHDSVAPCKNNNHGPESALSAATIIDTTRVIIDAKCGKYTWVLSHQCLTTDIDGQTMWGKWLNGRILTDLREDSKGGCLMFSYPEFSSCSTALQREAIIWYKSYAYWQQLHQMTIKPGHRDQWDITLNPVLISSLIRMPQWYRLNVFATWSDPLLCQVYLWSVTIWPSSFCPDS